MYLQNQNSELKFQKDAPYVTVLVGYFVITDARLNEKRSVDLAAHFELLHAVLL
jgi:hypothetical protein